MRAYQELVPGLWSHLLEKVLHQLHIHRQARMVSAINRMKAIPLGDHNLDKVIVSPN